MKTKLRLITLSLAAVCVSTLVRADDPPADSSATPPAGDHAPGRHLKMRENRLKMLDEKLQLTAAQKEQIQAIWDKAEADGKALREDNATARDDRREKMRDRMQATRAQVRAVLTPEQQKTFDAMPPEHLRRHGAGPDGEKPATAPSPTQP
ncbi:MAG: hypothetical protein JWM88_998 [Verrucomicrobia bacterium]|nr:hypothetical protein [Verrucomicrobiota bacterium]